MDFAKKFLYAVPEIMQKIEKFGKSSFSSILVRRRIHAKIRFTLIRSIVVNRNDG